MARIFEARRVTEDGKQVVRTVPVAPQPAPNARPKPRHRWLHALGAPWRWLRARVDLADVHIYGGIALVAYGCWLAWPPLAYMVGGALLVWLAVRPLPPSVDEP